MRNLLKIALVANIFEWYEFTIYAYLANLICQWNYQSFFDLRNWYLARPLGSIFFGIMGDRISRGWPLKMSLMMMAVPTILIGCLPTYHELLHCFCILIVK